MDQYRGKWLYNKYVEGGSKISTIRVKVSLIIIITGIYIALYPRAQSALQPWQTA